MKYILMMFVLFASSVYGQEATYSVTVEGRVKNKKVFSLDDLKQLPHVQIDSLQIFSHNMTLHGVAHNIKGVLLKDMLKGVEFDAETPKILSEYYIVCMAPDNYKAVFSWNEIFNSPTGDKVMIALEKDGQAATAQKDGIVLMTPTDRATGRRFIKGFNRVIIQRVN